jgi:hypothetical protein
VGAITLLIVSRLVVPVWAPNLYAFRSAIDLAEVMALAFSATTDWLSV